MNSALQLDSRIGLVAGNGRFPIEFAEGARRRGLSVVAVAHKGETDACLEGLVEKCRWVSVGEVGKLIDAFKEHGVRQAAFAGGIRKARLFRGFKPDLRGMALIARIRSVKDDVVLREVAREIENSGIQVFSASLLLEKSVPRAGLLTHRGLSAEEREDARLGWEAARGVGRLDIGQTVITHQGVVVAVEAVEGTDEAIVRAGKLADAADKPGKGCVVVKVAKPQQDLRFDLPTVGPRTVAMMQQANATALVIEAGKSIILDVEDFITAADKAKLAVMAIEGVEELDG